MLRSSYIAHFFCVFTISKTASWLTTEFRSLLASTAVSTLRARSPQHSVASVIGFKRIIASWVNKHTIYEQLWPQNKVFFILMDAFRCRLSLWGLNSNFHLKRREIRATGFAILMITNFHDKTADFSLEVWNLCTIGFNFETILQLYIKKLRPYTYEFTIRYFRKILYIRIL
jgi:hypothetical protein